MSQSVIDTHRDHIGSHRFVTEYDSGFEYLNNELGISKSDIPEGYRNIGTENIFRIHTESPRQFMIVQKNPNLKPSWVSGSVHGPHAHLSEWDGDTLKRNIEHSRTTVSQYLKNGRLEIILQALADEFGPDHFGFGSSIKEHRYFPNVAS